MSQQLTLNPKDAVGTAKVAFSAIPANVMAELGLAMMEGARKYGRHNFRHTAIRSSVYYDAVLRHLTAWWEGQDIDPDSGLSHITKAIATLTVLRDSTMRDHLVDDRPPALDNRWLQGLNEKAKVLIEKYPESKEAHTEKGKYPLGHSPSNVKVQIPQQVHSQEEYWISQNLSPQETRALHE